MYFIAMEFSDHLNSPSISTRKEVKELSLYTKDLAAPFKKLFQGCYETNGNFFWWGDARTQRMMKDEREGR